MLNQNVTHMNAEMKQNTLSSHDEIYLLLPWYVNRTLDAEKQSVVESHIEKCPACRRETELLFSVDDVSNTQDDIYAIPQNGFARLMQRIEQDDEAERQTQSHGGIIKERLAHWFRWDWSGSHGLGIAVSAVLVLAVALVVIWPNSSQHDPAYQTLTSEDATGGEPLQFEIVLSKDADDISLHDYIRTVWDMAVTIEKTKEGMYTFQLPPNADPAKVAQLLNKLKNSQNIKSVQLQMD